MFVYVMCFPLCKLCTCCSTQNDYAVLLQYFLLRSVSILQGNDTAKHSFKFWDQKLTGWNFNKIFILCSYNSKIFCCDMCQSYEVMAPLNILLNLYSLDIMPTILLNLQRKLLTICFGNRLFNIFSYFLSLTYFIFISFQVL